MRIYTYYENINFKEQDKLINLWKKSWENHGFESIVLSRQDAKKHKFHDFFEEKICELHEYITGKKLSDYGMSCWMRWLSYASQNESSHFYVSDYDVINHNFEPKEPEKYLHLMDSSCPCIASGTSIDFENLCKNIIKITDENKIKFANLFSQKQFVWFHDQEFFILVSELSINIDCIMSRDRNLLLGIPGQELFWEKQIVHYAHSLCYDYCKKNDLIFSDEIRYKIIEKYIK